MPSPAADTLDPTVALALELLHAISENQFVR
jgi:hypothetical protein